MNKVALAGPPQHFCLSTKVHGVMFLTSTAVRTTNCTCECCRERHCL